MPRSAWKAGERQQSLRFEMPTVPHRRRYECKAVSGIQGRLHHLSHAEDGTAGVTLPVHGSSDSYRPRRQVVDCFGDLVTAPLRSRLCKSTVISETARE